MSAFIVDGEIRRDEPSPWALNLFSARRFLAVAVCFGLLVVTNPQNHNVYDFVASIFGRAILPDPSEISSSSSTWQRYPFPKRTNYGIFSLDEHSYGVVFVGALQAWKCSFYDESIGFLCEIVADHFSHEQPLLLDPEDRAHTAGRILSFAILASAIISFCFRGTPIISLLPSRTPAVVQAIFSVFSMPKLYDLLKVKFCIYPALYELNRLVSSLRKDALLSVGNIERDFALSAIILVVLIGAFCNILTTKLTGRYILGLDATIGACLGYYQRATAFRRLITVFDQPITAASAFWTHLGMMILTTNNSRDWISAALAWIIAGWAGSVFAQYHLESQAFVGSFFQLFGGWF